MLKKLGNAWIDIMSMRAHRNGMWVFEVWEMVPGPAPDDFTCAFSSRVDYLKAVYKYYFGAPTVVKGWDIPLHRHPELTPDGVYHAIAEAINVSEAAFEIIAERRWKRVSGNYLLGKTRWEWALQYQFLKIDHSTDPALALQLRRDMQEAYIVHLNS